MKVFAVLFLVSLLGISDAQISKSVASDAAIDTTNNKFLQRTAHLDEEQRPDEVINQNYCPQNLAVRWHTEVSSGVVATPLITDLFSDGRKDIIVPGFSHYLEVVEGLDGAKDPSFQARHHSAMHTSPILYDADFDGVLDIVAATYEGEILFFKDNGDDAIYRMIVPRLRVRRDWYEGLGDDPIDHSKPDVGEGDDAGEFATATQRRRKLASIPSSRRGRSMLQAADAQGVEENAHLTDYAADSFQTLFGDDDYDEDAGVAKPRTNQDPEQEEHRDEDYHQRARQPRKKSKKSHTKPRHPHIDEDYEAAAAKDDVDYEIMDYNNEADDYDEEGNPVAKDHDYSDFDDAYHTEKAKTKDYEDEDYTKDGLWDYHDAFGDDEMIKHEPYVSPFAYVDAHILATPTIADIDGDGKEELIVAVSYFYDQAEYQSGSPRSMWLGEGIDTSKYVASGVVVFDMHTRTTKWTQHLDLSTAETKFRADAYSSPTVADINGDGKLEVILGTSMGFLYVLDPMTGEALEGWPVQMGDIQAQVAVADIDDDGKLEIIAADLRGSVAAFRANAKEVWETHLGSAVSAAPMLGDVDGDGRLEVVFGTYDGRIHVLEAKTGKPVAPFPYRTYGYINTPILLTKLDNEKRPGLQMAVVADDGVLYVVDGVTGCADTLDVGEPSRSMVLIDDLTGTGRLDLLVTTVSGTLYSIRTAAKYQPLKVWPSQVPGGPSPLIARWNWEGVYTMAESRVPRDVRGEFVPVRFKVVDNRPGRGKGPYKVSATLMGVGVKEMGMGDRPVIGMSDTVNATGTYVLEVPCPRTRTTATIRVEMRDEFGMVYYDDFTLSFHMHFYRLLKWMAVAPFVFTCVAILAVGKSLDIALPS